MGVALDRSAGRYLCVVVLQPRVQRLEGVIGHVVNLVYMQYKDSNDADVSVHEYVLDSLAYEVQARQREDMWSSPRI